MSSRPKIDEKDYLDLYIGWCLHDFAAYTPVPRDGKKRLLAAAAASTENPEHASSLSLVFHAVGHALLLFLMFVEKIFVSGPIPSDDELALLYASSRRDLAEVKGTVRSFSHIHPTAIGYFCMVT